MINQSSIHRSRCTKSEKIGNHQEEVVATLTGKKKKQNCILNSNIFTRNIGKKVDPTGYPLTLPVRRNGREIWGA